MSVYLYDVNARAIVWLGSAAASRVLEIRFHHHQHTFWLRTHTVHPNDHPSNDTNYAEEWEVVGGGNPRLLRCLLLADTWSWDTLFSGGYLIGNQPGEWIADLAGNKLLWLPPNWRSNRPGDVRWNGDSLALVGGDRSEPAIIRFHEP